MSTFQRPDCRFPEACKAKTPTKPCAGCSLSAKWKEPAFREKRAAAFRNRMETDPEFRDRHVAANSERLARWRASPEARPGDNARSIRNLAKANAPEAIAERTRRIRLKAYYGIPEHRWSEVRELARRMPAAEAKRIVREDEAVQGRREVERNTAAMRARREREKAQAY